MKYKIGDKFNIKLRTSWYTEGSLANYHTPEYWPMTIVESPSGSNESYTFRHANGQTSYGNDNDIERILIQLIEPTILLEPKSRLELILD